MENVSLITGRSLKKIVSVTNNASLTGLRDSSLQILQPPLSDSIYNIVAYNTFTLFLPDVVTISKVWIVLTGSVRRPRWYIVSCLETSEGNIALTGALKRSWIKALIFFMRFKQEKSANLFPLYDEIHYGSSLKREELARKANDAMAKKLESKRKIDQEWDRLVGPK